MDRWRTTATAIIVMGGLAGTACGDDGRSRDDFVAEGNAVCDRIVEIRNRVAGEHFTSQTEPPTVEQVQGFYAEYGPLFVDLIEELAAVEPADDDREVFDQMIEDLRRAAATVAEGGTDLEVTQRLYETDEAEIHAGDEAVVELGLNPEC